jgi:hypothetical protein
VRVIENWVGHIGAGRRAEARQMVGGPPSAAEGFDRLAEVLRKEGDPNGSLPLVAAPPLLLKDVHEGTAWTLTFRGTVHTPTREVEYQVTLRTDDPRTGADSWRIVECQFLGEKKREDPKLPLPSPPPVKP